VEGHVQNQQHQCWSERRWSDRCVISVSTDSEKLRSW